MRSSTNGQAPSEYAYRSLPEVLYSLSCLANLYEIGLVMACNSDMQEVRHHILSQMRHAVNAQGAALLLYHPQQQHFICVTTSGEPFSVAHLVGSLDSTEIARLTRGGPAETLSTMQTDGKHIVLVTLSYNSSLLGIIALSGTPEAILLTERGPLLSYMGQVAALLLRNSDLRAQMRQTAIEQERQRIARDLHDGVVQQMTYVLHKLEFLQHLLLTGQTDMALDELTRNRQALTAGLDDLRQTVSALRPLQLAQQAFPQALQTLIKHYQRDHPTLEVCYESDADELLLHLPAHLEAALFRFFQEALANVWKHAQATQVTVRLHVVSALLIAEVSDNGIGMQPASPGVEAGSAQQFGLSTMQERVQQAGGLWDLHSSPHTGTTIKVSFPLPPHFVALTRREREIFSLLGEGLSDSAIAQHLALSHTTVRTHVRHILQKLSIKDRATAVQLASDADHAVP